LPSETDRHQEQSVRRGRSPRKEQSSEVDSTAAEDSEALIAIFLSSATFTLIGETRIIAPLSKVHAHRLEDG
jgi:hypothetical protein